MNLSRWFRFRRDLGLQLLALYLLLIIPFLLTLWIFDGLVGQRIRTDVQSSDLALAQAIAQETDLSIGAALDLVDGLAGQAGVIEADEGAMEALFSAILSTHPNVNLVYLLGANGTMLYHYPEAPTSTVGTDFSFRDYFQRALLTDDPLVSQGRISPTTNQAVATAVQSIRTPEGEFLGLVGANIRLESLSQALATIVSEHQSETGFQVVILDSAGQIIAFPDSAFLLHSASDLLPKNYLASFTEGEHSQITRAPNGDERLYTHARIESINWEVVVSRPTSEAFSTQIILRRIVLVAAATFLLIGLFFWGTLSNRIIRPIEKLAPISEAIGLNKDIQAKDRQQLFELSRRPDQIGHLIRSIIRMEDSIRSRMKEQATLLETSAAVISTLDVQTVLDRILEQMGRLLAIQMYAIIQLHESEGSFRIRASRGLSRQFVEGLTILPSEPDSVTMRALNVREPVQVSDTETDPSYTIRRARARAEGYRAILAVPLHTQHAPPTALLVFHPTVHIFTADEIQLLVNFANHAAMAIENAILFERSDMRLQEQTRRLEALLQSMHDGLILSDVKGAVIYVNRRVIELADLAGDVSGGRVDGVLARIVHKAVENGDRSEDLRKVIAGKDDAAKAELSLLEDGRVTHLRLETFDVTDARGLPIGRGLILHDISADRELDRMKSSLVSTVSHELRTPLAAIKGFASTLLADDVTWDANSQKEFLTVISDETDRLTNLVNNLLDLSRIEAGSLRLSREACDLDAILARAAKQANLGAGNRLEVQMEANLPILHADAPRLETILRNLIENSVKYGGEQARIQVEVAQEDSALVFRVRDDGPGILPEQRSRVFDSFYRVDESLTRVASGAGLGLAICQGLVHAHGGRIWVEPVSQGTSIAFTIPLTENKPKKAHVRRAT